jgi:excisionase family DNA binding protein
VTPQYLRPAQAAERMSVSLSTVYRMLASKALRSTRIGRIRLIKVESIDNMISACTPPAEQVSTQ